MIERRDDQIDGKVLPTQMLWEVTNRVDFREGMIIPC